MLWHINELSPLSVTHRVIAEPTWIKKLLLFWSMQAETLSVDCLSSVNKQVYHEQTNCLKSL